ncbi:VOC family protein [Mycolicibacterium sp. P1-5]|uniref:VOC family protein n=1 Tax=Mycolicibacterium sp. P1-5 TaxID=2024617 RepID=UPI0011EF330C|nr:VOC family protein [Mycolicibacterium sp. P1-5]KAA0107713.1 hypothetical protein CIW47_17460 [Mycolicibacterium sp. P1-5]
MTNAAAFTNKSFMQMCWVVPDVRSAIDSWVDSAGVGPFFWFDGVDCVGGQHRGRAAEFPKVTAAIAYAGDVQIELVAQDNDDPGVFRDLFGPGQSGLHHMALICKNYESERDTYVAAGAELAFEGTIGNSRTCWVDTAASLGFMIELLEQSASRDAGFAAMRAAAESWDGTNPITSF